MGNEDFEPEAHKALGQTKDGTLKAANNDLLASRGKPVSPQRMFPARKIINVLAWMDKMAMAQALLVIII